MLVFRTGDDPRWEEWASPGHVAVTRSGGRLLGSMLTLTVRRPMGRPPVNSRHRGVVSSS